MLSRLPEIVTEWPRGQLKVSLISLVCCVSSWLTIVVQQLLHQVSQSGCFITRLVNSGRCTTLLCDTGGFTSRTVVGSPLFCASVTCTFENWMFYHSSVQKWVFHHSIVLPWLVCHCAVSRQFVYHCSHNKELHIYCLSVLYSWQLSNGVMGTNLVNYMLYRLLYIHLYVVPNRTLLLCVTTPHLQDNIVANHGQLTKDSDQLIAQELT